MKNMLLRNDLDSKKLTRCGVGALIVFGSFVDGTYHLESDIDVGAVF